MTAPMSSVPPGVERADDAVAVPKRPSDASGSRLLVQVGWINPKTGVMCDCPVYERSPHAGPRARLSRGEVMFWCDTCKTDKPDRCSCDRSVNVGIAAEPPSLDEFAALVRRRCREEAAASDEANLLRRLADEARDRYHDAARLREEAESVMRRAYNEAVRP